MDIDTVIQWLEELSDYFYQLYRDEDDREKYAKHYDRMTVVDKAIDLLKEQKKASKRNPVIVCPHCGKRVK